MPEPEGTTDMETSRPPVPNPDPGQTGSTLRVSTDDSPGQGGESGSPDMIQVDPGGLDSTQPESHQEVIHRQTEPGDSQKKLSPLEVDTDMTRLNELFTTPNSPKMSSSAETEPQGALHWGGEVRETLSFHVSDSVSQSTEFQTRELIRPEKDGDTLLTQPTDSPLPCDISRSTESGLGSTERSESQQGVAGCAQGSSGSGTHVLCERDDNLSLDQLSLRKASKFHDLSTDDGLGSPQADSDDCDDELRRLLSPCEQHVRGLTGIDAMCKNNQAMLSQSDDEMLDLSDSEPALLPDDAELCDIAVKDTDMLQDFQTTKDPFSEDLPLAEDVDFPTEVLNQTKAQLVLLPGCRDHCKALMVSNPSERIRSSSPCSDLINFDSDNDPPVTSDRVMTSDICDVEKPKDLNKETSDSHLEEVHNVSVLNQSEGTLHNGGSLSVGDSSKPGDSHIVRNSGEALVTNNNTLPQRRDVPTSDDSTIGSPGPQPPLQCDHRAVGVGREVLATGGQVVTPDDLSLLQDTIPAVAFLPAAPLPPTITPPPSQPPSTDSPSSSSDPGSRVLEVCQPAAKDSPTKMGMVATSPCGAGTGRSRGLDCCRLPCCPTQTGSEGEEEEEEGGVAMSQELPLREVVTVSRDVTGVVTVSKDVTGVVTVSKDVAEVTQDTPGVVSVSDDVTVPKDGAFSKSETGEIKVKDMQEDMSVSIDVIVSKDILNMTLSSDEPLDESILVDVTDDKGPAVLDTPSLTPSPQPHTFRRRPPSPSPATPPNSSTPSSSTSPSPHPLPPPSSHLMVCPKSYTSPCLQALARAPCPAPFPGPDRPLGPLSSTPEGTGTGFGGALGGSDLPPSATPLWGPWGAESMPELYPKPVFGPYLPAQVFIPPQVPPPPPTSHPSRQCPHPPPPSPHPTAPPTRPQDLPPSLQRHQYHQR